ncbi:MAG: PQQ-dependent sugar dehydrogenase [Bacteroidetes bacterium]|nr:PQQ-dependent sugar dehydrogenase [Bacteroidota bacterium]
MKLRTFLFVPASVLFFIISACNNSDKQASVKESSVSDSGLVSHPVSGVDLKLPAGFEVTEVAADLGGVRHIAMNSNGDLYVKLGHLKDGKGILVLSDTNHDGTFDKVSGFGDYEGTGIAIKNGYLYASSNTQVFRYKFDASNQVDTTSKQLIVTGLIDRNEHNSKSIALDDSGYIYVNIGAPSNACQVDDRSKGSPGMDPCPLLDSAGGIWRFKADQLNQSYKEGLRYATGIRNVVGLDWNKQINQLFAMQHGRDQLHELYPDMYDEKQSAELPAEEMLLVKNGSNFGWPYCYYDEFQNKKILAPEYGGDSKKQGRCEGVDTPVVAFPGHWAPNAMLFYTSSQFPQHYSNGAFICFHGSWNRAPEKQAGFCVAFVPFKDGMPSGHYEIFADGFTGVPEVKGSAQAKYRPMGIAMDKDGSLYVADSQKGMIWKVTYKGK